jgi:hypothetical protein
VTTLSLLVGDRHTRRGPVDLLWEDAMIAILGIEVLPTNFRSFMAFLIREIAASRFRELEPGNAAPSFPISSRTPPSEGFCLFLEIAKRCPFCGSLISKCRPAKSIGRRLGSTKSPVVASA